MLNFSDREAGAAAAVRPSRRPGRQHRPGAHIPPRRRCPQRVAPQGRREGSLRGRGLRRRRFPERKVLPIGLLS